jgi:hypothetical protein
MIEMKITVELTEHQAAHIVHLIENEMRFCDECQMTAAQLRNALKVCAEREEKMGIVKEAWSVCVTPGCFLNQFESAGWDLIRRGSR